MITVEASTKLHYNFASDHFKWSIKCVTIQSNVVRIHTIRRYSHVDLPNPNHQFRLPFTFKLLLHPEPDLFISDMPSVSLLLINDNLIDNCYLIK